MCTRKALIEAANPPLAGKPGTQNDADNKQRKQLKEQKKRTMNSVKLVIPLHLIS